MCERFSPGARRAPCCGPVPAQDWPPRTVTVFVPFIGRVDARQPGAHRRRPPAGQARPAVRGREPARRQRQYGHRRGGQGRAGRPHAGGQHRRAAGHQRICCSPRCPTTRRKDIAPITILAAQPSVLVTNPGRRAPSSVAELLALHEARPRQVHLRLHRPRIALAPGHGVARAKAGVKVVHLPFPGSPAAVTALLRGDVQLAVLPAASVVPQGREGKLKMLAVTSPQRSPAAARPADLARGRHRRRGGRCLGRADRAGRHAGAGAGQDPQGGGRRAGRARGGRRSSRRSSWCRSAIRPTSSAPC